MPTSVINARVVLIGSLDWHDERVYEEMIFCETSLGIKVNCHFPSQNNRTSTKLTKSNNQSFYQEKVASLKMPRSPRLVHKAPVMQASDGDEFYRYAF